MSTLLTQGLFSVFDVYLVLVTLGTLILRLGLVRKVLRVVRRSSEWPRVSKLLLSHVEVLLGPRMLAPIAAYSLLFAINAIVRTFVFPHVDLSFADVLYNPLLLLPLAPIGWVMVRDDVRALDPRGADFSEHWVVETLNLAEALLGTVEQAERLLSESRRGALQRRVVKPLSRVGVEMLFLPDANRWARSLVWSTATKLLFGLTVWMTWALFLA